MTKIPQPAAATLVVVILSTILLLLLFQKMIWLVLPLLLALLLYYSLRPVVDALVVHGWRRETAAMAVCLFQAIIAAGIVVLLFLFLTKAGSQGGFTRYLAGGQNLLRRTVGALEEGVPVFKRINLSAQLDDQHVREFGDKFVEKNLLPVMLQLLEWLPSLLLVPYITYFMLTDSSRLKKYIIQSVPNAFFERVLLLFSHLDTSLQSYFQGLLLLTVLEGSCLAMGLALVGIPHAIFLGLAAALLAWVPYLGSIVGCLMVVLVAATDFPDKPGMAYACLGLFLGVRLLDDFIFMPLTVGRQLHVHPLLSVLMLFLGATVAGATGLVFALPLYGVIAVIGETIAQIVTDPRLRARYKAARHLAATAERF
ncbi:MAG: AI-2E family transporter [Limisphaerales bacterium]